MDHPAFPCQPLDHEPWVKMADADELASWSKEDQVMYNQKVRHLYKYSFYVETFAYLAANEIGGDYFEFGCHRVRTFRMALTEARKQLLHDMRFFAFDSFEGLPELGLAESEHSGYVPGALCTPLPAFWEIIKTHGLSVDKVQAFPGFYNESLTPKLAEQVLAQGARAAMINLDCDIYESAVPVFNFIEPFLQVGTILYLDDMFAAYRGAPNRGVHQAFLEFQAKSSFSFETYKPLLGSFGRAYVAYK
ncbi:MAG: TylF/MycF/NovP-related O-methyltransferase [Humidesulfovibrio sp.]|uniref:TylF/MycF/NovP-related O-methyltransferase n=1 Tax=Humidesulfovibrio sp. TaxID=2910988 RepID=UPI0027360B91|nr:TylF/MycF/NovP-related O-methyltransferase [Humidesulfovibrio sp.]MDP2848331.1 TylF/MycF/NovP-related O-methyltransferase [Humidesulfovibrio sp.]